MGPACSGVRSGQSPITAIRSHWICIGGVKSPLATVWRAGRECGSGNISTQYLLRIGLSARSVIHTVILTMSSVVPPAVSMTRRTLANIAAHCWSRSSGTLPVAGSAPEIAPDTTNGPRRLALGIGLTCRAPATSMLRRFSMIASSQPDQIARMIGSRQRGGNRARSGRDLDGPDHSGPVVVGAGELVGTRLFGDEEQILPFTWLNDELGNV